jgi:16S rRNA processing protein RimM
VATERGLVAAGRVGRPHGLDGTFHVREASGGFAHGSVVVVAGTERRVERRAGTDAMPLVRLEGLGDREAAAALTGETLFVADERPELGEGEWLADDLVGCEVAGAGVVRRVLAGTSCDVLELEDGTLVPLVADAVKNIDLDSRRIEIDRHILGLS